MEFKFRANQISSTSCQRLTTAATLMCGALAQSRGDGHRSFVTPERVLSDYNEDLNLHFAK